jgi:hypothetical protein
VGVPRVYWVLDGLYGDRLELLAGVLSRGGTQMVLHALSAEYPTMPRALKRLLRGACSEGYSEAYSQGTQLILGGTEGALAVVGCTLGYSRSTRTRERSKAELFGFSGFRKRCRSASA